MKYTANIYGTEKSKGPDIIYSFEIGERIADGKWHNYVTKDSYSLCNELINEMDEKDVIRAVHDKVEELLNCDKARKFLISPRLRLYYDDEQKKPSLVF